MKFLSVVLSLVICIALLSISVMAQDSLESNVSTEYVNQEETTDISFGDMCKDLFVSTNTIVSIVMVLLLGVYVLFFKKEIPKRWGYIIPACYLVVIFLMRLFLRIHYSDLLVTFATTIILGVAFIVNIQLIEKQKVIAHEGIATKNNIERKALNTIQRLLNRSHHSIECIQLYSFEHNADNEKHTYDINFLGGASKKGININALFSSAVKIPKEYVDRMMTILSSYSKLKNDEDGLDEAEQNTVALLMSTEIEKLKKTLNNIQSADDVTEKDCYIARILLLYISLYATIQEHDTYIGLGRDSLGLNDPKIEAALFTFERTGILGALLFDSVPYIFSYKRGGNKIGRFYYTFSFNFKKRYIVTISMKNRSNEYYIDYNMSQNLNNIFSQLSSNLKGSNTE